MNPMPGGEPDISSGKDDFLKRLHRDGVLRHPQARLVPLRGGVSSDIFRVEDGDRVFAVKRALDKLKVSADWFADTSRNAYEQAYIREVAGFRPDAVPGLLRADPADGYFCMEYLDGFVNWKEELLAGNCDVHVARRAGALLGEIHRRTWHDPRLAKQFDAMELFDQLRIDPYLRKAAERHPAAAPEILAEAARLRQSRQCLVHGDFSPKNLLHRDGRLVILDCEVACFGDAAFDVAFLLNHLLLKAAARPDAGRELEHLFHGFVEHYQAENPSPFAEITAATNRLLPMLMLARVDGKSPVEYLTPAAQEQVRGFALHAIANPAQSLAGLAEAWFSKTAGLQTIYSK